MKNLLDNIELWSKELGFQQVGISNIQLTEAEKTI